MAKLALQNFSYLSQLSTLTLFVCADCNLGCAYCSYRGLPWDKRYMTLEVASQAIDFLMKHSGQKISISFYGGEPLLNFKLIKETVAYTERLRYKYAKKIRYNLSTNGTICDQTIINFLKKHHFHIAVSLDGPAMLHDKLRRFKNGRATHGIVVRNIKKYFSQCKNIVLLACLAPANFKYFNAIYRYFYGFYRKYKMPAEFSLVSWGEDDPRFALSKARLKDFEKVIERGAVLTLEHSLKKKLTFDPLDFTSYIRRLEKSGFIYGRCGAGLKSLFVLPDGRLLPCHLMLNRRSCPVFGNIMDLRIINEQVRLAACRSSLAMPARCRKCRLNAICNANCPACNLYYNNDNSIVYRPHCEIFKEKIEAAAWLKTKLAQSGVIFK